MGCGMSLVKYILFIFNLLCALIGIAWIAAGAAVLLRYEPILDVLKESQVNIVPIVAIVIGSIMLLISFFGCCGAIRESHCMVSTYATFLFLLLVSQIVFSVLLFTNREGVGRVSDRILHNLWKDRDHHPKIWDGLQQTLECCGLNGPADWSYLSVVPKSCCADRVDICTTLLNAFDRGCSPKLREALREAGNIFGISAMVIAGVLLSGFILSCCLMNNIRNRSRRSEY